MKTKIIEVSGELNWGKFLLGRPDVEWQRREGLAEVARVTTESVFGPGTYDDSGRPWCAPLLATQGWGREHLWVLDLATGEGAFFKPGGVASYDLQKHRIWVCPMYEPFLEWLYVQDLTDLDALPDAISLLGHPQSFAGYRRPGLAEEPA